MKIRKCTVILLVVALLLGCTGCAFFTGTSDEDALKYPRYKPERPDDPPYYGVLYTDLGKDLETVISAMDLKPEDFENRYGDCYWYYKEPVEYLDYDFQMMLEYQQKEHVARVIAVRFELLFDGQPEEAAAAVIDLREKLEGYHTPDAYTTDKEVTLQKATKEELVKIFSDPEDSAEMMQEWVSYNDLSHVPIDPLDPGEFNCTSIKFGVSYSGSTGAEDGETQKVCISLSYGLRYFEKQD